MAMACILLIARIRITWSLVNCPFVTTTLKIHSGVAATLNKQYSVVLNIPVLQAYYAVITEYGISSDFVRKSTASLQIKITTAQLNFSNRNVIIF